MATTDVSTVVAGAGIAGLTAALQLQHTGHDVLVVDASDRPGGVMRTDHVSGFVIERGPNTFLVKAPMLEFLHRIGADQQLIAAHPTSRKRFVYAGGRLNRVPMSPLSLLTTPLLSARGKLRLLAEPFISRGDAGKESAAQFAARRLGAEAVEGLIGPMLTGIYAGDEHELGAEAVFPTLVECERSRGSIALGLVAGIPGRRHKRGLRGNYSATEGLGPLARGLAERLVEAPALNSRVTGLRRDGDCWLVFVSGPGGERQLRAKRVILAVPAPQAAEILRALSSEVSEALEAIDYAPIVGVPVGVDPSDVREKIEGFGFLVSRDANLRLLGCLFMSQLFPNRAPANSELLQCILGGARWREAIELSDDAIHDRINEDLDRTLGLRAAPKKLTVSRWPQAIPQPARDHVGRIAWIRTALSQFSGLALAGSYVAGVGVPDALASGLTAARDVSA